MPLISTVLLSVPLIIGSSNVLAETTQPTSVIFENVRIFNGASEQLSTSSNVLVVGNVIKTISDKSIAVPRDTSVTSW